MEGIIVNFRGSNHVKSGNQMIILPKGCDSKDKAAKLVGKTVTWTSPAGKELKGKVSAAHGGNGAVRVLFETGMPGQAIGTVVKIE
jgi:large subunit ribosomal protein L35Ae